MTKIYYKCRNCENSFRKEDAGSYFDRVGERSTDGYWCMCCPECRSDDIEEAKECDTCGEVFFLDDLIEADGFMYCKECADRVVEAYWLKWGKEEKTA